LSTEPVSGDAAITITVEECPCILSTLTIFTNKNTFFGVEYPNGYPISFGDFTEGPPNTFVFNGVGVNNTLILLNQDNNLTFIPETENCYGEMSYQWKNWGCNSEILEPIPPGIAVSGEMYPTKEGGIPSEVFTVCNPPYYNTLYIYLGGDTYVINVSREK